MFFFYNTTNVFNELIWNLRNKYEETEKAPIVLLLMEMEKWTSKIRHNLKHSANLELEKNQYKKLTLSMTLEFVIVGD